MMLQLQCQPLWRLRAQEFIQTNKKAVLTVNHKIISLKRKEEEWIWGRGDVGGGAGRRSERGNFSQDVI